VIQSFELYKEWNEKINLISRKDIDSFYEKHFLHSLAIAKFIQFEPGTSILDIGTGGGFPGIPLAIYFPEVQFHLVDSIAKKIGVVADVAIRLGLDNVKAECTRCETLSEKYDFVMSRAVAPAADLIFWNEKNLSKTHKNSIKNGFLFLKGGDLKNELAVVKKNIKIVQLFEYFEEPFFAEEKKLVYIPN
jgi:16S rRNA (guanine527-N7)-methyltransferase